MFHSKTNLKMKNRLKYSIVTTLIATTAFLGGCSDEFLKEKQDYTNTTNVIYNSYAGAKGRIDDIYALLLPRSTSAVTYDYPSSGVSDIYSQSTEEYGGLSKYVDGGQVIDNTNVDDFFYNEAKTSRSPWGRIRNCNDAIEGITNGTLPESQKKELLGQAYFWRAWVYYRLVDVYGGVPIIDHVQNPIVGDEEGLQLVVPRSTAKECVQFICNDLEKAADYLPVSWSDSEWGRVTSGTALALMGRVRLLYASPLFNRKDIKERWDSAYSVNKRAIERLQAGGYGLAYLGSPGVNGSNWAKMFSDIKSPEAVLVTLYNSIKQSGSTATSMNNGWENSVRPYNTYSGSTGRSTTGQMVDLFPLSNGTRAVDKNGNAINGYDPQLFFLNRDPRFYRTFAFPGVEWKFSGDPTSKGDAYPYKGENYVLWNYTWYATSDKQADETLGGYAADGLALNYRGIYLRKRSDDFSVNSSPLYTWDLTNSSGPFGLSCAPFMEMRYAEVLLNFAESACGAAHYDEALTALRQIRLRVGYTGNCGLDDALMSDRAALFAAILYERQIELAYEGKRYEDMRRWMLWDGGDGQESVNANWKLVGFNGNTCDYLGVARLNGKRRVGMEIRVSNAAANAGLATLDMASDPLKTLRPTPWNLNTVNVTTAGGALENFYRYYLTRKNRLVDEKDKFITYRPQYYFWGLKASAQTNNVTLLQTVGWFDSQKGTLGTFDPLAE